MTKNSFIVYTDIRHQTKLLTLEQTGALFLSMLDYAESIQPTFTDPLVQMAFSCVQPRMDRDREKYEAVCAAHREAGKKGGRPRKNQQTAQPEAEPIFLPKNQMDFPKTDNGLVSSVNDYESDSDTVSVQSLDHGTQTEPTETCDRDGCERDFQDVLAYAKRAGFTFTSKQRKRLRNFVNRTSFEYVISAIDRAVFHQGRTATYVMKILDEWWGKGLTTTDALTRYLERREGGESA
ncbi:MAG: DnaD domain protein [Clostridiales bacterium]|nr:DnaD domain protein [Clostridiales bacterium]